MESISPPHHRHTRDGKVAACGRNSRLALDRILDGRTPVALNRIPGNLRERMFGILEHALCFPFINNFLERRGHLRGIDFLDAVFDELECTFSVSQRDRRNIPAEGALVCIANHPLGALDGLAVLRMMTEIRPDVRIVVNDVLLNIRQLSEYFLPFDIFSRREVVRNTRAISAALERGEAVIFFPAAEVSRLTLFGIRESRWLNGAAMFARKHAVPVLPLCVDARNSLLFYLVSLVSRRLSMFMLPREMVRSRGRTIAIRAFRPVAPESLNHPAVSETTQALRNHLEALRDGRSAGRLREVPAPVVHPANPRLIKCELKSAANLGTTPDGKQILLTGAGCSPAVMREIARLRELTFRAVNEGTGHALDTDRFDATYRHLLLWDNEELEIMGAYRFVRCSDSSGRDGSLYTSTLFDFLPPFFEMLPNAVELGRSFIQPRYWNSRALDNLWHGIGAYLSLHPEIRYLFGPVSLSAGFPEEAREAMVFCFRKWFSPPQMLARALRPFTIPSERQRQWTEFFTGPTPQVDLRILRAWLKDRSLSMPPLYYHYSQLCDEEGVWFSDFSVDPLFHNCIDGFVVVDLARLKEEKRQRYINGHRQAVHAPRGNIHTAVPMSILSRIRQA